MGSRFDPDGFPLTLMVVSMRPTLNIDVNILLVSFQDMVAAVDDVSEDKKGAVDYKYDRTESPRPALADKLLIKQKG